MRGIQLQMMQLIPTELRFMKRGIHNRLKLFSGHQNCVRKSLSAGLLLISLISVQAVDPLPEHIENASEEVRNAYIERLAKESLEEKIEVGKERHEQRMRFKNETIQHMRSEAEERIKVIRKAREESELLAVDADEASRTNLFVYAMCILLLGGMLYYRKQARSGGL